MTQSGNGNGQGEYKPQVEYERVVDDSDVFYRVNPETGEREDVLYAKDVIEEIDELLASDENSDESDSEDPA